MFDSLDYITDLRNSLDSTVVKSVFDNTVVPFEELDENAKAELCSMVSALGFIRLYGIDVPVDVAIRLATFSVACDFTTTGFHMMHVANYRAYKLRAMITDMAQSFPERFDEDDLEEGEIADIFHMLMELWAIRTATSSHVDLPDRINFTSNLCKGCPLGEGDVKTVTTKEMDVIYNFVFLWDVNNILQHKNLKEVLSSVTSLPLFDNWRKMLVKPYCDDLPWWLDGTLEKVAKKIGDDIDDDEVYSLKALALKAQGANYDRS